MLFKGMARSWMTKLHRGHELHLALEQGDRDVAGHPLRHDSVFGPKALSFQARCHRGRRSAVLQLYSGDLAKPVSPSARQN
jgi:hypothetical protein